MAGPISPEVLLGVGAAGLHAAGSIYNTWQEGKRNRENIQFQKETNARREELYKEKLAYNSPAQQAARYKEAGFNPHVIFSQIGPGNADHIPNVEAPHKGKKRSELGLSATTGLNALGMMAQVRNMHATNANLEAQNSLIASQKQYYDMMSLNLGAKSGLIPFQKAKIIAETETTRHNLNTVRGTPIPTNATSAIPLIGRGLKYGLDLATSGAKKFGKWFGKKPVKVGR